MQLGVIFPGQGVQFVGMGADVAARFPIAQETFEEADDCLGLKLSDLIFHGPSNDLMRTEWSQPAIFVVSMALLHVVRNEYPELEETMVAGLSLGEYTALVASGRAPFREVLQLVRRRGELMGEACNRTRGGMALFMGISEEATLEITREVPGLWPANYNCPGQLIVSGTEAGLVAGGELAKKRGAKRVLRLEVQGAFHSPLMEYASLELSEMIQALPLANSSVPMMMNASGDWASEEEIRRNLLLQITHPVKWEQGIKASGVTSFLEIGPGKTLAGMNKRIDPNIQTMSIGTVEEIGVLCC